MADFDPDTVQALKTGVTQRETEGDYEQEVRILPAAKLVVDASKMDPRPEPVYLNISNINKEELEQIVCVLKGRGLIPDSQQFQLEAKVSRSPSREEMQAHHAAFQEMVRRESAREVNFHPGLVAYGFVIPIIALIPASLAALLGYAASEMLANVVLCLALYACVYALIWNSMMDKGPQAYPSLALGVIMEVAISLMLKAAAHPFGLGDLLALAGIVLGLLHGYVRYDRLVTAWSSGNS